MEDNDEHLNAKERYEYHLPKLSKDFGANNPKLPLMYFCWRTDCSPQEMIFITKLMTTFDNMKDEILSLKAENKELLSKFNEILTALTVKKTDDEEIAELQGRIQAIYNKKK